MKGMGKERMVDFRDQVRVQNEENLSKFVAHH